MKQFLRWLGRKLRNLFETEHAKDGPRKYIDTNSNGKRYVKDVEKYLEAGNCFKKMERASKVLRKKKQDGT